MKKILILIIAVSFCAASINAEARIDGYDTVAKSDNGDIILYAKKRDGVYSDFKIDFKGAIFSRPFWINTTSCAWSPQIFLEDINGDEQKELIIILTKGYGTGVLEQEAHVFHIQKKQRQEVPVEVLVDNPIAIVLKNVKTKLSADKAEIQINDKKYLIDVKSLGIQPEHLFKDIFFGNIIDFETKDNHLIAKMGGQISPASFIGEVIIVYEYRNKMYREKSIEFHPFE
ncbi:hypothetical protein ACQKP0_12105 [Heyndrickxia sp. NPDC080065]|uniref:hypothetical protein n=1 Tax=Heyndrickxia sp. NPDC080065 TaxID=3390568 RepID=UPI003CFEC042